MVQKRSISGVTPKIDVFGPPKIDQKWVIFGPFLDQKWVIFYTPFLAKTPINAVQTDPEPVQNRSKTDQKVVQKLVPRVKIDVKNLQNSGKSGVF